MTIKIKKTKKIVSPRQCNEGYIFSEKLGYCIPKLEDPFWVNTAPIADAGENKTVAPNVKVTLDGSKSYDPDGNAEIVSYAWSQVGGATTIQIEQPNSVTAFFTSPKIGTVPPVEPPPEPPGEGEFKFKDEFGITWISDGQQTTIAQSRDEADDDRWSDNVEGCEIGFEATMIAKSVGSADHFAMKQGGSNHSKGDWKSERWLDTGWRSNGDLQLQYEGPHPSNHDFELDDAHCFIRNLGFELVDHWLGVKWRQDKLAGAEGSPANGGVRWRMWIDRNVSEDGTPSGKWELVYDFIDGKDVNVIEPQDYVMKGTMDAEVRRSGTKDHEVLGGGLHVRTLKGVQKTKIRKADVGGGDQETIPLKFQLRVTDKYGASSVDLVDVIVAPDGTTVPPVEPPPEPLPEGKVKITAFGDTDQIKTSIAVQQALTTAEKDSDLFGGLGDYPYSGTSTKWTGMMDDFYDADMKKKLVLNQGNHEDGDGAEASEDEQAQIDIEEWAAANGMDDLKSSGWVTRRIVKNVYYFNMNSQDEDINSTSSDQYKAVAGFIDEAKKLKSEGKIDWVIGTIHKPWRTMKSSHSAYVETRNAYYPIFKGVVDIILSGHNHNYQRHDPMAFEGDTENLGGTPLFTMKDDKTYDYTNQEETGIMQIVAGEAGHEWNPLNDANAKNVPSYRSSGEFGYIVLEIEGKKLHCVEKDVSGKTNDEFYIVK
jgi:hypothetical protein